jgi:hypothetical protein
MKDGMYGSGHGGRSDIEGNHQNTTASAKTAGGVVASTMKPPFPKKPTANKAQLTRGD